MLLGFKKRFALPIQIGTKVFTMRKIRKVQPKIGEKLYMYSGLRTSNCELISNKEKLVSIQEVYIDVKVYKHNTLIKISVNGRPLNMEQIIEFVKFDGFKDIGDFVEFWAESTGQSKCEKITISENLFMYHWTDLTY